MKREEVLLKLKETDFDICIIGAGASGAGCALDAALRGYKVALIDRNDFSAETSSKSTKLIHGGVRYLEQAIKKFDFGQLKQVKHGLEERHTVLNNAPHLTSALGLITPVNSWIEGLYFTIGLKIYGFFAKNDSLPKASWLSKAETIEQIPNISKKIHSSVLYYDGQLNDSRYALAIAQTACENGAVISNYTEVVKFNKSNDGLLESVKIKDSLTGEEFILKSRIFINCTGPFSDNIRRMANDQAEIRLKPSKGVHISISNEFLKSDKAILIPKTKDGRVVFVIPFENQVIVGTTDTQELDIENEPILLKSEIEYLLETVEPFLDKVPTKNDIKAGFGGLRPLITSSSIARKDTKTLLRDHEIEFDNTSNLISLLGGKWTTYRIMAKDTIDFVDTFLGVNNECLTANFKLSGAQKPNIKAAIFYDILDKKSIIHLQKNYGDRIDLIQNIIEEDTSLAKLIHPEYPYILAEIVYTIRFEMVQTFRDFFARRIRFELIDWKNTLASIEAVAEVFAKELKWDESKLNLEKEAYTILLNNFKKETY